MNLKINYFENVINMKKDYVNVIEIENKKYFYRFVRDLYCVDKLGFSDNIILFDSERKEVNLGDKIKIHFNYFDLGFDSKKIVSDISKLVLKNTSDEDKMLLQNQYHKLSKIYKRMLNNVDLPLVVDDEIGFDSLSKVVKLSIQEKDDLLDNLLILIDAQKLLRSDAILIFINLKQYLTRNELVELYKYSIYNQVFIILVDSQCYGGTIEYEKKLIIDDTLDEFVL